MRCLGFNNVDFKPLNGDRVQGVSCSFMAPYDSKDGVGYEVFKVFLSAQKFEEFNIEEKFDNETEFQVFYNRYGKIDKIV